MSLVLGKKTRGSGSNVRAGRFRRVRPLGVERLEERCLLSYMITDLGTFGGAFSLARGVNAAGEVVGQARTVCGSDHAFLYCNGVLTDLGALGGTNSDARAINDLGQVIGGADLGDGTSHAFLYSDEVMCDLGTLPGSSSSIANGINDAGQVAGLSYSTNQDQRAFLYNNGAMTDLGGLPGADFSGARGLNGAGQVIGTSHFRDSTGGYKRAFLATDGVLTGLGTFGGMNSETQGIDADGQVVGFADTVDATHAFLYSDGDLVDLGTLPGYLSSMARGINSFGQIVGTAGVGSIAHAFLDRDGVLVDLNDLLPEDSGWTLTDATGINDAGQIVGQGTNPDGQSHAYLLTPGESLAALRRVRLDPSAARRLATPWPLMLTALETTCPITHPPANPEQIVGAETGLKPKAKLEQGPAMLATFWGHQPTDVAFLDLGWEQPAGCLPA
jgi:probable HAF family extracellular repeat protein